MRCEVEINVNGESDEFDSLRVPPCLLDTPEDVLPPCNCPKDVVRLPKRYVQRLYGKNSDSKSVTKSSSRDNQDKREKDLNTALKWIKQEIVSVHFLHCIQDRK